MVLIACIVVTLCAMHCFLLGHYIRMQAYGTIEKLGRLIDFGETLRDPDLREQLLNHYIFELAEEADQQVNERKRSL